MFERQKFDLAVGELRAVIKAALEEIEEASSSTEELMDLEDLQEIIQLIWQPACLVLLLGYDLPEVHPRIKEISKMVMEWNATPSATLQHQVETTQTYLWEIHDDLKRLLE